MNLVEIDRALRKLRLSGMADVLETRIRQAQSEKLAPIDFLSALVSDELSAVRTGSSHATPRRPASETPTARSTASTSTSTKR